jgi:hypothetical protein
MLIILVTKTVFNQGRQIYFFKSDYTMSTQFHHWKGANLV